MGKYQAYPEYKDSGIEWLGSVPAHWNIQPLLTVCNFQSGKAHEPFIDDDGAYVCVNSRYVSTEGASKKFCNKNLSPAKENDILMVMSDLPNGRALAKAYFVRAEENLAVNQRVCILSASKARPRFLFYLLDRNQLFLMHDDGVNQTHLSNALFTKFPTTIPSEQEQISIANFLDHETAKIDTLIEKQQHLIQLLKEKRQAVISHAVTKGLNANAPMKDSGVEWLGEVPEGWETPNLNQVTHKIGDGLHSTPNYEDGTGYYFINGNNLIDGNIVIGSAKEVPEDDFKRHYINLTVNSVLLSINGTVGNVAVYAGEQVILGKSAAFIDCAEKLYCRYLMFYLQSSNLKHFFELEVTGTTIFNLSLNSIRKMKVCVPPLEEQKEIEKFCVLQKEKYDRLISNAIAAITLMQERRTALISAAVTGKIDVRNFSAQLT